MQNVGRSLHREGGSGAPGVQSAVKVLVEIQKYVNIVFLKDVELAASFAVESSSLALSDTEAKKLERLEKERFKRKSGQFGGGSEAKRTSSGPVDKSTVRCFKCWGFGHYSRDWECPKNQPGTGVQTPPQQHQLQIQHHPPGWSN